MLFKRKTYLGIVAEESSLVIAEVYFSGRCRIVSRSAEWPLPEGKADPSAAGQELKNFLRSSGFSASTAVMGIPARWILSREKKVPEVDRESLSRLLAIEAEKDFSFPTGDLVMDYIKGGGTSTGGCPLFIAAATRSRVLFLGETARKAGLRVTAVLPLIMALPVFSSGSGGILYIGRGSAEFMLSSGGLPVFLKYLPVQSQPEETSQLPPGFSIQAAREIEKALMLLPDSSGVSGDEGITVWDDRGIGRKGFEDLSACLPMAASLAGDADGGQAEQSRGFLAAASLAELAGGAREIPMNFIKSRMSGARSSWWKKNGTKAAAALIFLLAAAAWSLFDIKSKEEEVLRLKEQSSLIEPGAKAAETMLKYAEAMESWKGSRMPFLDCLRDLTLSFPGQGRIWVTSIAVREDMKGLVSGKAADGEPVLDFLSALRDNGNFSDVNLLYIRRAAGNSGDSVYAVSFVYSGQDEAAGAVRRKDK